MSDREGRVLRLGSEAPKRNEGEGKDEKDRGMFCEFHARIEQSLGGLFKNLVGNVASWKELRSVVSSTLYLRKQIEIRQETNAKGSAVNRAKINVSFADAQRGPTRLARLIQIGVMPEHLLLNRRWEL